MGILRISSSKEHRLLCIRRNSSFSKWLNRYHRLVWQKMDSYIHRLLQLRCRLRFRNSWRCMRCRKSCRLYRKLVRKRLGIHKGVHIFHFLGIHYQIHIRHDILKDMWYWFLLNKHILQKKYNLNKFEKLCSWFRLWIKLLSLNWALLIF